MSLYGNLNVGIVLSENTDLSNPEWVSKFTAASLRPEKYLYVIVEGTTTIDLSMFTSIVTFVVKNMAGTTTTVSHGSFAGAVSHKLQGGKFYMGSDITPAGDITVTPAAGTDKTAIYVDGV